MPPSLTVTEVMSPSSSSSSSSSQQQNITNVESMSRGHDGRIEHAFAKCKERNEAAFVTFVTAGFPSKEGKGYRWRGRPWKICFHHGGRNYFAHEKIHCLTKFAESAGGHRKVQG